MQITEVRIKQLPQSEESRILATATIILDECFAVHELRLVKGMSGLFVAMPRMVDANGDFKDTAHPITAECRYLIQHAILEAWATHEKQRLAAG